jgi:hypothetical protein
MMGFGILEVGQGKIMLMADMVMGMPSKQFRLHQTPYKTASAKNIKQLDYFIKEDEREEILNYCINSEYFIKNTNRLNLELEKYELGSKEEPFNRGYYRNMLRVDASIDEKIFNLVKKYEERARAVIEYTFGFPVIPFGGSCDLRKWHPGEYQEPHADSEGNYDGTDDYFVDQFLVDNFSSLFIDVGCIMYLNDEYSGGEIYFPAYEIEIKPKPGDLIFFPGSHLYMHGVKELASGNRYTLTTFYTTPKMQFIKNFFEKHINIYPDQDI